MGAQAGPKKIAELKAQADALPAEPGVYFFRDGDGKILYVGKAASLRKRVGSYFRRLHAHSPRIGRMVRKIDTLEIKLTASEAEALLLEAEWIKAHTPPYNVLFRDDKRYPMLKVTKERFPRLVKTRKRKPDGAKYFGPYADVGLVNEALRYMQQVFPLRTCKTFPETPCLEYHLGQCLAPCAGYIDETRYDRIVHDVTALLSGKKDALLRDLTRRMHVASKRRRYEEAARLRDQIEALTSVVSAAGLSRDSSALDQMRRALQLKKEPRRIEAFDISHTFGTFTVASMVVFKEGKPLKGHYRRFKIETVAGIDDYACMREVILRRYSGSLAASLPLPDLILIDGGRGQLSAGLQALRSLKLRLHAIGLAKRFEHIITPDAEPIVLLPHSPVLQLVQHVRDEAHRFALAYHRRLRGKTVERSVLERVPGIGKVRAQRLLQAFGGLQGVAAAEDEALRKAGRMSAALARAVKTAAESRSL